MNKIGIGDTVTNKTYGTGRVLKEWDSFLACPECYAEVSDKVAPCHNVRAIEVSGQGIFEVAFADRSHSIHGSNLSEV